MGDCAAGAAGSLNTTIVTLALCRSPAGGKRKTEGPSFSLTCTLDAGTSPA